MPRPGIAQGTGRNPEALREMILGLPGTRVGRERLRPGVGAARPRRLEWHMPHGRVRLDVHVDPAGDPDVMVGSACADERPNVRGRARHRRRALVSDRPGPRVATRCLSADRRTSSSGAARRRERGRD